MNLAYTMRFWPFYLKTQFISWQEIKECYVREYSPIAEYGRWGYRVLFLRKKGQEFNVKGNIGTQRRDEDKRVLKNYNLKFSR
jgi:hypothetical protein